MNTHGSRTIGETLDDDSSIERRRAEASVAGVVLVFCDRAPTLLARAVGDGEARVGRDELARAGLRDERLSREHAVISRRDGALVVRDVGSRNGSWVDGARVWASDDARALRRVLRCGRSLWVAVDDVLPYQRSAVEERGGFVVGPRLRAALQEIESLAARASTLFIRGESGSGKELAARSFHEASPGRAGPFVAVNCATVPSALAERLFFGARRGVYSGAHEDTAGFFQAADGGTLFLDEVAELDLATQAKLLRAIETREITPLGHTKSKTVDLRVVAATLAPLERAVEEGRFRADLYHRLASPSVRVPSLRERREEIPFLVRRALSALHCERAIDAELIEQCLLHDWPGNVRQLLHTLAQAANRWSLDPSRPLRLPEIERIGVAPATSSEPATARESSGAPVTASERPARRVASVVSEAAARAAVDRCGGNISAAARSLGLHRTQLRRLLARSGSEPDTE